MNWKNPLARSHGPSFRRRLRLGFRPPRQQDLPSFAKKWNKLIVTLLAAGILAVAHPDATLCLVQIGPCDPAHFAAPHSCVDHEANGDGIAWCQARANARKLIFAGPPRTLVASADQPEVSQQRA